MLSYFYVGCFDHPDVSRYHPARLHHHPLRAGRSGRAHAAAGAGLAKRVRRSSGSKGAGTLRRTDRGAQGLLRPRQTHAGRLLGLVAEAGGAGSRGVDPLLRSRCGISSRSVAGDRLLGLATFCWDYTPSPSRSGWPRRSGTTAASIPWSSMLIYMAYALPAYVVGIFPHHRLWCSIWSGCPWGFRGRV